MLGFSGMDLIWRKSQVWTWFLSVGFRATGLGLGHLSLSYPEASICTMKV